MGTTTDAILCYGIPVDKDDTPPWDTEEWDGDEKDWWRHVNGYVPPYNIYDKNGNYRPGITVEQGKKLGVENYKAMRAFDKEHPMPVDIVMHCSGEYPMWIVAAKGSIKTASRGYPERIPDTEVPVDAVGALLAFCKELGYDGTMGWYLASLWMT